MSANAKVVDGELASPPTLETDRNKLAHIVMGTNPEYPCEVHSRVTKSCLARFRTQENAEGFIANVSLDVLRR